jgi:hypothetical protein
MMKKAIKIFGSILYCTTILSVFPLYAISDNRTTDIRFTVAGIAVNGRDLKHSGYDWLDYTGIREIPLVMIFLPALSAEIHATVPDSNGNHLFSADCMAGTALSLTGIEARAGIFLNITPLLTFGVGIKTASGWNYGTSLRTFGVYDPDEKEYKAKTSLSEAACMLNGSVSLNIPMGPCITQIRYSSEYSGFTGASDGQPWECNMESDNVNGWKYQASGTILRQFKNSKLKTAAVTGTAAGWYNSSCFDSRYRPYDPDFIIYSVTPMINMELSPGQTFTVMGIFCRERRFENEDYDGGEQLLQRCTGGIWRFKSILCIWNWKLN